MACERQGQVVSGLPGTGAGELAAAPPCPLLLCLPGGGPGLEAGVRAGEGGLGPGRWPEVRGPQLRTQEPQASFPAAGVPLGHTCVRWAWLVAYFQNYIKYSFSKNWSKSELYPICCWVQKETVSTCCCCSVAQSCPTLQPHGLQHARPPCPSPAPEFTQTHAHRVGDAIQPSDPLSSPSPPAFSLSQHQGPFQ